MDWYKATIIALDIIPREIVFHPMTNKIIFSCLKPYRIYIRNIHGPIIVSNGSPITLNDIYETRFYAACLSTPTDFHICYFSNGHTNISNE